MNQTSELPYRYFQEKELHTIMNEKPIDQDKLEEIAKVSGFINDLYRIKVWKRMIDVTKSDKLGDWSSKSN